jgi:hypothetical protein
MIILCALILISCTSSSPRNWDSAQRANQDWNEQRQEEMSENVGNQFPTVTPGTERNQPF